MHISAMYSVRDAEEAGWEGQQALYFATFMNAVNQRVVMATGLTILDFSDWGWAEAFQNGGSVDDVACNFLADMWEGEML